MILWVLVLISLVVTWGGVAQLNTFARRYPSLTTRSDLERYRSTITIHKWLVLIAMVLTFALPVVIMLPAFLGRNDDVNWWPILLLLVSTTFRSKMQEADARCRSLPVAPELAAEYAVINRVWVDKVLPRFPAPTADDSDKDCDRYQRVRDDGYDDDAAMRRNSVVLQALGLSDVVFGASGLNVLDVPALRVLAPVFISLGVMTFVGGTLLSWRRVVGYRTSLVCAALHVPLLPAGTAIGVWMLVSMRKSSRVVSREYVDAVARAKTGVDLPVLRYLLLGVVITPVYSASLFMLSGLVMFAVAPALR